MRNYVIILLLLPLAATAQKIYKHVDEEGNVIYSDEPIVEGAQPMDLPPLSVVKSEQLAPLSDQIPGQPAEEEQQPEVTYELFEFHSPGQDESLWGAQNEVTAALGIRPSLADGHRIRYSLDGQPVAETTNPRLQLTEVYRGTHRLTAQILNEEGRVVASTGVTFHMKQPSVINPANPAPQAPQANQARPSGG